MMTFTKISLFLILIAGIALAVFGRQILRPVLQEKATPVSPSLSPEANYLVEPYQKAKKIQELQDSRFTDSVQFTK